MATTEDTKEEVTQNSDIQNEDIQKKDCQDDNIQREDIQREHNQMEGRQKTPDTLGRIGTISEPTPRYTPTYDLSNISAPTAPSSSPVQHGNYAAGDRTVRAICRLGILDVSRQSPP